MWVCVSVGVAPEYSRNRPPTPSVRVPHKDTACVLQTVCVLQTGDPVKSFINTPQTAPKEKQGFIKKP